MSSNQYHHAIDKDILKKVLPNLQFIEGVSIYYDPSATKRRRFDFYASFDAWIEAYSKQHDIPFFHFKNYAYKIKEIIDEKITNLQEDYHEYLLDESLFNELKNIKGFTRRAGDEYSYHNCIWKITRFNNYEKNYSIVTENGMFLLDNSFDIDINRRFENEVNITNLGLFQLIDREITFDRHFPGKIMFRKATFYMDYTGRKGDPNPALEFISKREGINNPYEFSDLLNELKDLQFEIIEFGTNKKRTKSGSKGVEWGKLRPDGLTFIEEVDDNPRRIHEYRTQWVTNSSGEIYQLSMLYNHLTMLENGRKFLESVLNKVGKNQKKIIIEG
jgi:hypothetical protein